MPGLNKVLLIGNLTRDPVSRATSSGLAICEMGLATNRRYRTSSGEDREDTCFVDIDVFGRTAEHCLQYLRKGSLVFVEGRLRFDQWEDRQTGQKRSRLKVTAERVQFLDSRPRQGDQGGQQQGGYQQQGGQQQGGYQQQGGGYPQQQTAPPRPYQGSQPQQPSHQDGFAEDQNSSTNDESVDDIPF